MCGIAGVICLGNSSVKISDFKDISLSNLHRRGPDAQGSFEFSIPKNNINKSILVHTRLSIQDLSSAGLQPMMSDDDRFVICFNGEIYNYTDLRMEFLNRGVSLSSSSDTELFLKGFEICGVDFFSKIIGMWSVCIVDLVNEKVVLSRDRFGEKPLYYSINDGLIVFSSVQKTFEEAENSISKSSIFEYLNYRSPFNECFNDDVCSLPGGYYLEIDTHMAALKKYWDVRDLTQSSVSSCKKGTLVNECDLLLNNAVQLCLTGDVPVGAFLSGGLDSSLIVAMATRLKTLHSSIDTFSVGFEGDVSELTAARRVSSYVNSRHHEIVITPKMFIKRLPELIKFRGAPCSVPNEVAISYLSESAAAIGIKVLLSGEGADELFCGYDKIFSVALEYDLKSLESSELCAPSMGINPFWTSNFNSLYRYGSIDDIKKLIGTSSTQSESDLYITEFEKICLLNPSITHLDIARVYFQKHHLKSLLNRLDSAAMFNSIETRVPFLNHKLTEFSWTLPIDSLIETVPMSNFAPCDLVINKNKAVRSKSILRQVALKYLPQDIVHQRKVGFPVPLLHWMRCGYFDDVFSELLDNKSGLFDIVDKQNTVDYVNEIHQSDKSYVLWFLINLHYWITLKNE